MSITDELREYALGWDEGNRVRRDLTAIADRIDAEHESKVTMARGEAVTELGHKVVSEYVKLPVDADGEPIHVGDSIEIIGGEDGTAVAIELCEDGGWNVSMRPTGWDTPTLFAAESVRHHHEPTVEDVLREMLEKAVGYSDAHTTVALNAIAEYAAKLRLAGDAE